MTALLAATPGLRLPNPMRRHRGGWPVALSVLLHVGLLLLALVLARHERPYLEPAPPAPVAMVFESGGKTPASIANPAPKSPNASGSPAPVPTTPPSTPPVATQAPPAPLQPPPPPTPVPPAPRVEQVPTPTPPAATTVQPPSPEAAPPTPRQAETGPGQPAAPATAAEPLPPPPPPPPVPRMTQVHPPAAPRQAAPQRQAMAFPAPMDFSLGPHTAASAPALHLRRPSPGTIDLSFSDKAGGGEITQLHPYGDDQDVGSDWDNLLTKWWIEHRYYPEEAVRLDQQGEVVLHLKVAHNGHVESVELQKSSGSPWIDLAALGTLRDANLPPLPKDFTDPDLDLIYHLHYILIQ